MLQEFFQNLIMNMDSLKFKAIIRPSQGIHLVIDKKFLNGNIGILVPKTSDGRVLFAVPWLGHVILGTTDTLVNAKGYSLENNEIDFILKSVILPW